MSNDADPFLSDAQYTYDAMMENFNILETDLRDNYYKQCASTPEKMISQLSLISLHFRDKSWQICKCSVEKHLPTVSGLAKDGLKHTDDEWQKDVLSAIMDDTLKYRRRLEEGQLTKEEASEFGKWVELAIDELEDMQRSWSSCVINTADYLKTLSGLAGEGVGFTEDEAEKKYMQNVRDTARSYGYRMSSADISVAEADAIRAWAREQRRRLSRKLWVGELPKTSRKDEGEQFDKKPDKKQMMKEAKKVDEDGKKCSTCTTVPDKYKNKDRGSSEKDYVMVTVPTMDGEKQVRVPKQDGNEDIQWIVR